MAASLYALSEMTQQEQRRRQDTVDELVRSNKALSTTLLERQGAERAARQAAALARAEARTASASLARELSALSSAGLTLSIAWCQHEAETRELARIRAEELTLKTAAVDGVLAAAAAAARLEDSVAAVVSARTGEQALDKVRALAKTRRALTSALGKRKSKMALLREEHAALERVCADSKAGIARLIERERALSGSIEQAREQRRARKRYATKVARLEATKENLRIEIAELRHEEKQAQVQERIRVAKKKIFSLCSSSSGGGGGSSSNTSGDNNNNNNNSSSQDSIDDPLSSDSDDFE